VIGKEAARELSLLGRPDERLRCLGTADEHVVDPGSRRGVALDLWMHEVEVAGEDDRLARPSKVLGVRTRPVELGACVAEVGARVEVRDDEELPDADGLHDAAFEPDVADLLRTEVAGVERSRDEDRVRLADERRPEEAVMQPREETPETAGDARRPCDDRKRLHPAPFFEVRDPPDRELLETDDVLAVAADELEHLPEVGVTSRRERVPVEDVPGSDDERQARDRSATLRHVTAHATRGVPRHMRGLSLCVAVLVLAGLAGSVGAAQACSCVPPDPWTYLQQSDGAFVGHLVDRRDTGNGRVALTFSVERTLKGRIGETVEVRTSGSGASCGIEASVGQRVGLFLVREGGAWIGSLCRQVAPEDLLAAVAPLPAPNGRGPVAMYAGGSFGRARVLALDAQGRTLAYGFGPGSTQLLSPCPGGERLAEVILVYAGNQLVIRDAKTLRIVRRRPLDLPAGRTTVGLQCENAWGSSVVLFGTGPGDAPHGAALHRLAGRRLTTIWKGTAYLSSLTPRIAYLNAGERAARLLRIDLRTGRGRPIARLPLAPQLVPDDTGRRLAGVAYRATGRSRLVLVELGKATTVRSIPLAAPMMTGDVHWLPDGRLLFLPLIDRDQARVLDGSLRTRSRFSWTAYADTARVGSTAFGVDWRGRLVSAPLPAGPERVVRRLPGAGRAAVIVSVAD
jgi:hypothetical protein